jgi:CheY-like chemotaxis protein
MPKKIIIIDQDQDIVDILRFMFEEKGFTVTSSANADLISEIAQIRPDLILLDTWLQGNANGELCSKIKRDPETASFPVYLLSTSNQIEAIALQAQADGFVTKPFDISIIYEIAGI